MTCQTPEGAPLDPSVLVSVVIPAYNAAAFLERTLDSVRAQTYCAFEAIVVDNGSTDGTGDMARAYLVHHQMRGRVISRDGGCPAASRNTGMRAAAGTYIALLDSDDLWHPEKLAVVMAEFERHPELDLICHDERVRRGNDIVRVSRRRLPARRAYETLLLEGNPLSPSATVVRRDRALAEGGFDERPEYETVEDYDFWLRFSRRGGRIRVLNRLLGDFVLHDQSASRRVIDHHVALERMLRAHLDEYLREHPGLLTRVRARRRLARVYRSAVRQLIAHGEVVGDQPALIGRMMRLYPFELRNLAVALWWMIRSVGRPLAARS